MNRIFAFVIVSTLIFAGSNVIAQRPAQLPRPGQQTEKILYANERTSVVPRYRGYRKPNIENASKTAATFKRSTRQNADPQPTSVVTPFSQAQTTEAAPVIDSHSRRISRTKVPSPATEMQVQNAEKITFSSPVGPLDPTDSAPVIHSSSRRISKIKAPVPAPEVQFSTLDTIERAETQTDVVKTRTPVNASPDFIHQSLSDNGQEDLQQNQWTRRSNQVYNAEKISLASPLEQSETTESAPVIHRSSRRISRIKVPAPGPEVQVSAPDTVVPAQTQSESAPVIHRSSRHITKIKVPVPAPEVQASTPDAIDPAQPQIDVVKTRTPAKASPNFKYRSPSDYGQQDLQQSQWKPRPKQVPSAEKVTLSSPVEGPSLEPLNTINTSNLFEVVESAFSAENIAAVVPLKAATLDSEEESPFSSFTEETAAPPTVKTENIVLKSESTAEVDAPVASAGLTTKAKLSTTKKVHASAVKENSRQKAATSAWWFVLPLLAVPFLVLLGWALLGGQRHKQYAEIPAIDIPRQSNTPWQKLENAEPELICKVANETRSAGFNYMHKRSDELSSETEFSETELLDEIKSISSIASNSNSASKSNSDSRAKTEK